MQINEVIAIFLFGFVFGTSMLSLYYDKYLIPKKENHFKETIKSYHKSALEILDKKDAETHELRRKLYEHEN